MSFITLLTVLCITNSLYAFNPPGSTDNTAKCPFSGAMAYGQARQRAVEITHDALVAENILILPGMPGAYIWADGPHDQATIRLYDDSQSLLWALQMQMQTCPAPNGTAATDALRALATQIPEARRRAPVPQCRPHQKYVEPSGVCNKLSQPNEGAAHAPYARLIPAAYADGLYEVRKGSNKEHMPSPRVIGNRIASINSYQPAPQTRLNHGGALWGQIYAHDTSNREVLQSPSGERALRCCTADNTAELPHELRYDGCYPIRAPIDDPFFGQFNITCLDYIRSQPVFANDGSLGAAQMANAVTHVQDQSNIYGSSDEVLKSVRSFRGGELLNSPNNTLPMTPNCTFRTGGDGCYFAGDMRGTLFATLSLWTSVWIRTHNYIARGLTASNPSMGDEQAFQEARRLTTALTQSITYNEWLPLVLGDDAARQRNITCDVRTQAHCGWYDASVEASTLDDFSAGAFRLLHVNSPLAVNFYDEDYNKFLTVPLEDSISAPYGPQTMETHYNPLLRGLLVDSAGYQEYPNVLRTTMFSDFSDNGVGLDLLAIDISRGRDHGLAPYSAYYSWCTNQTISDWSDLSDLFAPESIEALQSLYASVGDVDLIVGLLLEKKVNVLLGPVARCIFAEQFYRSKTSNRFFYSLPNGANPFTEPQLNAIHNVTMADILCATTDIGQLPERAFERLSVDNPLRPCRADAPLDFTLWQQKVETPLNPLAGLINAILGGGTFTNNLFNGKSL